MKTRVFILCAGVDKVAGNIRKELLKIAGEEIIRRTIRLFKTYEPNCEIFIVTQHVEIKDNIKELKDDKLFYINPAQRRYPLETMLSTQEEWVDKNIIVHGDVIFSSDAVKKMVTVENKLCFFSRRKRAVYTKRKAHEVYGMLIPLDRKEQTTRDSLEAIDQSSGKVKGRIKRLANFMTGRKINSKKMKRKFVVNINDATDDIDSMRNYRRYIQDIVDTGLLT
ncbi:hypothetical protein ES705_17380 [subsurface metagenome]